MSTLEINQNTLQRLRERATAEHCSLDDLLTRLLDTAEKPAPTRPDKPRLAAIEQGVQLTTNDAMTLHIQETNALLQLIIDSIPVMIAFFDEEGHFRYVNSYWLALLGWNVDELDAHPDPLVLFYPNPDYRQSALDYMLSGLPGWRDFQVHTKHNGVLETSWASVRFEDGRSIGIGRDITEQKRAREDLETALEQNQRILNAMFDGYLVGKPDGTILDVNQRYCDMLGYSREELLAKRVYELDAALDQPAIDRNAAQLNGKPLVIETRHTHRDGHLVNVEISTVLLDAEHMACFIRDITRRKQNEAFLLDYERLKASFQKEQHQNSLIQWVISTLSHDLRAMLAVIATSKDILVRYAEHMSPAQQQEKLETIGRQLRLAVELLDDTVTMVRNKVDGRGFQPSTVNLAALCRISVEELGATRGQQHHLRFINLWGAESAFVDEILISRILLNLLSNAIKYSPQGTEILLELSQRDEWLVLRVVDHGIGMHPDALSHIFEPFYRANGVDHIEGTGLGLSIVKDCVEKHQGQIHVDSTPNVGTVFTIELPMTTPVPLSVTVTA